jgi:hypothetical protein
MSFEIGSPKHNTFPVAKVPGTVTKLLTWPVGRERINAANLAEFTFLPEGETAIIDKASAIEVVEFGWYSHRGTEDHHLAVQRMNVDEGSVLSGPIAWRSRGSAEAPKRVLFPRYAYAAFGLACAIPVVIQMLASNASGADVLSDVSTMWVIGAVLGMSGEVLNNWFLDKKKTLATNPIAKVYTPARRLWA